MYKDKNEIKHNLYIAEKLSSLSNIHRLREDKLNDFLKEKGDFITYGQKIQNEDTPDEISVLEVCNIFTDIYLTCDKDDDRSSEIAKRNGIFDLYSIGRSFVVGFFALAIEASCKCITLRKYRDFNNSNIPIESLIEASVAILALLPLSYALPYVDAVKEYLDKTDDIVFADKERNYYMKLRGAYYPFNVNEAVKINVDWLSRVIR